MSKFLFYKMAQIPRIIEKSLKISNYNPFIYLHYNEEYKVLGTFFPSSRMNDNISKKPVQTVHLKKSSEIIDKKFSDLEKFIGLDFPSSRFE